MGIKHLLPSLPESLFFLITFPRTPVLITRTSGCSQDSALTMKRVSIASWVSSPPTPAPIPPKLHKGTVALGKSVCDKLTCTINTGRMGRTEGWRCRPCPHALGISMWPCLATVGHLLCIPLGALRANPHSNAYWWETDILATNGLMQIHVLQKPWQPTAASGRCSTPTSVPAAASPGERPTPCPAQICHLCPVIPCPRWLSSEAEWYLHLNGSETRSHFAGNILKWYPDFLTPICMLGRLAWL